MSPQMVEGKVGPAPAIKLTVLGSGTAIPSARRRSAGYLLRSTRSTVLIESGSGTMQGIAQAGCDFRAVDAILYSHFHVDHTSDLPAFLFASRLPEEPRTRGLEVIGPPGIARLMERFRALYGPWLEAETYSLQPREISEGSFTLLDWMVTCAPIQHTEGALAYRFEHESGRTLAYSGDTDYCENLVRIARGADVALFECSYPDGMKVEGHLTPSLAGRAAREAHCGTLVLTHFYPPCDLEDIAAQAGAEYAGVIVPAEDLLTVEI